MKRIAAIAACGYNKYRQPTNCCDSPVDAVIAIRFQASMFPSQRPKSVIEVDGVIVSVDRQMLPSKH